MEFAFEFSSYHAWCLHSMNTKADLKSFAILNRENNEIDFSSIVKSGAGKFNLNTADEIPINPFNELRQNYFQNISISLRLSFNRESLLRQGKIFDVSNFSHEL